MKTVVKKNDAKGRTEKENVRVNVPYMKMFGPEALALIRELGLCRVKQVAGEPCA